MNRLLVVDGHAYAYRAFHAIRDLRAPDGRPTNAIFGFIKMLDRARMLATPTHVAVMWDGGLDSDRLDALPDYKGQRPDMPDDLEPQLDEIEKYLKAAGILSACEQGVEADDLIATLTLKASRMGWHVVIATSDKDFMQLVTPSIELLNPGDKQQPIWNEAKVMDKTGVYPRQIVDWLSLVGDSVDNIQGVAGVGPKTAARLLAQFNSIQGIYSNLDEVESERVRTALATSQAVVERNQTLVALKDRLQNAPSPEDCQPTAENRDQLRALFQGWGLKSMAAKYASSETIQGSLL